MILTFQDVGTRSLYVAKLQFHRFSRLPSTSRAQNEGIEKKPRPECLVPRLPEEVHQWLRLLADENVCGLAAELRLGS